MLYAIFIYDFYCPFSEVGGNIEEHGVHHLAVYIVGDVYVPTYLSCLKGLKDEACNMA